MDKKQPSDSQANEQHSSRSVFYTRPQDGSDEALRKMAEAIADHMIESHKRDLQSQASNSPESTDS